MTLVRLAFLMAIGTLFAGFLVGKSVLGPLFSSSPAPPTGSFAQTLPTATSTHLASPSPVVTAAATISKTGTPSPTPVGTPTPAFTPTPTTTPSPSATATAAAGTVTLSNYFVGSPTSRRGTLLEIGYVINNATGSTKRVMLGASLKPSSALSWTSAGISDPTRDVVAIVRPGISTHYRYFLLSSALRPGSYDVAWGLRNAVTGARDDLSFAPGALRIVR